MNLTIDTDEIRIKQLEDDSWEFLTRVRNTKTFYKGVYKNPEEGIADCYILFAYKSLKI